MPQKNKLNNILSIVIPVFNEEKYLAKLISDLEKYFSDIDHELIFINDGSSDDSRSIIKNYIDSLSDKKNIKLIDFKENCGKGKAVREGINQSSGDYVLLQDADLELDIKDSRELYDIIINDKEIKCIFGSRYLSGKLKRNNYFFNELVGRINSIIFNILFSQSLSDIHCGLKIINREVINKIKLSINDFGLEIDLAAQIAKNNFNIYEYGVSYYFRTIQQGKKITWIDGIKSYFYLFKVRFLDNPYAINLSILFSVFYMSYVGSHFGKGLGQNLFILVFVIIGLFIGLKNKILPSAFIFIFIFIGSLFGQGQGKVLSVFLFFILGLYLAKKICNNFSKSKNSIINFLF